MIRIKDCNSIYEFASCLNLHTAVITNILYNVKTENCYKKFTIPKSNGNDRTICAPNDELKSIQKRLSNALYYELKLIREADSINPKISNAFEKRKSILTNCEIHKRKRFILNIDLKDFFEQFHYGRVYGYFRKNKHFNCTDETARIIANLACFNGTLPQGAPTSPIITNLIFQAVDSRILKLTKEYRLDYTRYADDLTFSTNRKDFNEVYHLFLIKLNALLKRSGFDINQSKIRISFKDSRQTVTGLVVNNQINVCNNYYKLIRAYARSLYIKGSFDIKDQQGNLIKTGTVNQLEGMLSFIHMIDKHNKKTVLKDKVKQQRSLNKREREYQRFLFYKYFYKNDKPLIITEGKTDPIYLCCALKKYHELFPELITKTDTGFKYNIQILKKSKRLRELFSFVDGADSMTGLYKNFYACNNIFPDYYKELLKLTKSNASHPVLFIFDNELNNSAKPLHQFVKETPNKEIITESIQKNGWTRIISDKNLYVVTNPLVDSKSECEIEDLFKKEFLEKTIDGKKFSLEKDLDINLNFGKDIFSKMVARDYKEIDFSRFIPFLERIRDSIADYSSIG